MAYITTEEVKEIRQKIKKKFPTKSGWKFSIKREYCSGVNITILQAPVNFLESHRERSNIRPGKGDHSYLQQIFSIANAGNHDNSDSMTDYFDVGWYVWLSVGSWDKKFEFLKK